MSYIDDCLLDMFAAWPHFKPPDPDRTISVYARALSDIPEYALVPAVDHLIKAGGRFFPTVSDVRAEVQRQNIQPPRDLTAARYALERKAWAGEFDPAEWERFEVDLRQSERPHAAELVAQKRRFFEGEEVDVEKYREEFTLED